MYRCSDPQRIVKIHDSLKAQFESVNHLRETNKNIDEILNLDLPDLRTEPATCTSSLSLVLELKL